ncbi:hypothetical protein ScPMuIL_006557 [Solemya velum]
MERTMPDTSKQLIIKTHSILDDFNVQWNQKLGTGVSGPVRPCVRKLTGEKFALKCIIDVPHSRMEAKLHRMCSGHSNIVKVFDIYANDVQFPEDAMPKARLLMVLELMEGGELFDRISKERCFTERKAARYMKQMVESVRRCHDLNIAHRDLKPENFLLKDSTEESLIKLSDYGFAKIDDGNLQTPQFTPYYVAPQVLEAYKHQARQRRGIIQTCKPYTYDKSCDMWSLGVILYIMLCGYPPFYSETPSRLITPEMRRKILSGEFEFPEDDWQLVSESAKDIVRSLLHVDPGCRMTIEDLATHHWLNDAPNTQLHSPAIFMDRESMEDMRLAHAEQLTAMRMPENNVKLKPLVEAENPIMRKRKYTNSSFDEGNEDCDGPSCKIMNDLQLKPLRDIIAFCILPPKADEDETALNDLVTEAMKSDMCGVKLAKITQQWEWDGCKFQKKVDKLNFVHSVSQLVKSMTSSSSCTSSNSGSSDSANDTPDNQAHSLPFSC